MLFLVKMITPKQNEEIKQKRFFEMNPVHGR